MRVSEFDYLLPEGLIAQKPASPRESARLLMLGRASGEIAHQHVRDLPKLLRAGDTLVVNVSKVFKARLQGRITSPQPPASVHARGVPASSVEVFLVRPEGTTWRALAKPGKKLAVGSEIAIARGFRGIVRQKDADGSILVDFGKKQDTVVRLANAHGEIPLPPYITRKPKNASEYQTAYARHVGSVAAPTAGFHLTKPLIAALKKKGVRFLEVTLHVGLGTFFPIRGDQLEGHRMHAEWIEIPAATAKAVAAAKRDRRRVIAVGTTTVRALEGAAAQGGGTLRAWRGDVDLFIKPGFEFRVIDGLMTNFHLPKSTLLVLVSAFAGRSSILNAYKEAVGQRYRFYSYGDAMLIL